MNARRRSGGQLDGLPLAREAHLVEPARGRGVRLALHVVERGVVVERVVVEEAESPRARMEREGQRVTEPAVAPAEVTSVLGVRELTVVDEQIRVPGERQAGDPFGARA